MATDYDPSVLTSMADQLYQEARSVLIVWTLFVGIVGFAGGVAIGGLLNPEEMNPILAFFGCILGMGLGYSAGQRRGFHLKLQAQMLLVQLQIEVNTRKAAR